VFSKKRLVGRFTRRLILPRHLRQRNIFSSICS